MTNDEINRYIHEEIMGECWHDWHITSSCTKCGDGLSRRAIPGYCSDDSPRRLLNEVVTVVASPNSYAHYKDALFEVISRSHSKQDWREYNNSYFYFLEMTASAEQIARACVEAHKESKK